MVRRRRRRSVLVSALAGAASLSVTVALVGVTPAVADPPAPSAGTESVIVLLRDQLTATPASRGHVTQRRVQTRSTQSSVLTRLARRGGPEPTQVVHYTAANALSATVTAAQAAALAADPAVAKVIPNTKISLPAPEPVSGPPVSSKRVRATAAVPPGVCPADPKKPLLEPEALTDTRTASDDPGVKTAQQLATGAGVKVAYIADGINPDNPDLIRANGQHVITDYQAFSADGPNPTEGGAEAYGDASAIAAQGRVSYDLSDFVNPAYPLPTGCNIRILGMAPGASIVALKIDFYTTSIIQAIDYAVTTAHVDVINESFGGNVIPDTSARGAIQAFNDAAVDAGVTVTASAGDAGTTSTIGNPASDPRVISVAADTNSRLDAQTGYAGARTFGNGGWVNDEISSLSSGGITQRGGTVDLTAPGESGWAICDPGSPECANYRGGTSPIQAFGGTSQSAPLTAGAAALVIQAYRSTHGGDSPSPRLVKRLLSSTATDLGLPPYEQGAGLLNARAAVEAALTYPGAKKKAPTGVASNIALSTSQLEISGRPGSRHTRTLGVRNVGSKKLTVAVSTRDFANRAQGTRTVNLSSDSAETFAYPTSGVPWAYRKVTFKVPAGTDRLVTAMIWQGAARKVGTATVTPVVRLTLIQPDGRFVTNSRPQGGAASANYANADVRSPAAGTWTAVLYTVASAAGYTGPVTLQTTSQQAVPVGTVSRPAFTLKPGQRKNVKVKLRVPAASGDATQAITVGSSDGHSTAVAVTERAVVPITSGRGSFTGVITGGNARAGAPAQTLSYGFTVPRGKRDLSVGLTLADDPGIRLAAFLVDPHDQTQSVGTNAGYDVTGAPTVQGRTLQLTTAKPVPGRWRLVIQVQNPVTGHELTEQLRGTIGFNTNRATTSGLPTSTGTQLVRGRPTRATVRVTNTGIAPLQVQLDPRAATTSRIPLTPVIGSASVALPDHAAPVYLVPPGTTGLTATAVSSLPALVELQASNFGIDVVGDLAAGKAGSTVSVARVNESRGTVGTGFWSTDVNEVGPVGTQGAPTGTSRVDLNARTPDFDRTVQTSTGDLWASLAADPAGDPGTPAVIQPGASATITVAITPTAKVGTTVRGVLYVVTPPSFDFSGFNPTGDVLTGIPYAYTVEAAPSSPSTSTTSTTR